jgi:hypothetical protein
MIGRLVTRFQPAWLERLYLGAPLRIGRLGELALSIRGKWHSESVFVLLVSKIDESGTHGRSTSLIMAGYTARLGQWNRFDVKWRKALRRAGLEYFHAKEHWKHSFAANAVTIPDRNLLFGFVARLDKEDYDRFYRQGGWGDKAQPDSMYGLCFRYCLSFVLQQALIEEKREGLRLDFVIESGHPNEGAPAAIVARLKRNRIKGMSEFLGSAILGEKREVPGLQVADGLAFGARLRLCVPMINIPGNATVATARSRATLKAPIFRCHLDGKELTKFKNGYFANIEHRRLFGQRKPATDEAESDAFSVEQSS